MSNSQTGNGDFVADVVVSTLREDNDENENGAEDANANASGFQQDQHMDMAPGSQLHGASQHRPGASFQSSLQNSLPARRQGASQASGSQRTYDPEAHQV